MLVIRDSLLEAIELAIANAIVEAMDHHGRPAGGLVGTIDPTARRQAALAACVQASGQSCVRLSDRIEVEDGMPLVFAHRRR